jgi:staphylococcal nuclease domain-containing protein 1
MVEKLSSSEKLTAPIKGALVKAVHSGDYMTLTKGGKDYNIFLSSVQAPKIGSSSRNEEPFGFEAREFLRERIIGKKCEFHPEYNHGGRDYGTLVVKEENVGLSIVKAGLAKVLEKKGSLPASSHYEELVAAQAEAKNKKLAIHAALDDKYLEKHTRQVTYFSESGFNAAKLFEEGKTSDKPLEAIVEHFFNASFLTVYLPKFHTVAKISMVFLFTPSADKDFVAEGKAFAEKLLLHRTIGVKFERYEPSPDGGTGSIHARIFYPLGDIAYEVLKNGYAKLNTPKTTDFDADYYKSLKEA